MTESPNPLPEPGPPPPSAQQPGYQQPGYPPPGYPPPGYPQPGPPPDNFLVWAILSTVLCCLPLGIVSIVYAAQVNDKWLRGDVLGAAESARKAKQFAIWSVGVYCVLTGLFLIVYIGFFATLFASGVSSTSP